VIFTLLREIEARKREPRKLKITFANPKNASEIRTFLSDLKQRMLKNFT